MTIQIKCKVITYLDLMLLQTKQKQSDWFVTFNKLSRNQLLKMGLSWGEAQASAKDRTLWRNIVVALCPAGDEGDK